ncbi:MAG: sensor histidine kinase [Planctomycetota bacterium]|nr:MAG: sensor histidine kinase [Planctomycetota bacterium]
MRIQQKFGLLYAMLGVTAAINLAVAAWAIRFLARELSWPLQSIQEVMLGLHRVKRGVEDQSAALGFERGSGASLIESADALDFAQAEQAFATAFDRTGKALAHLEERPSYLVRSGVSTTRNLRARLESIGLFATEFWQSHDPQARARVGVELGALHELIERLEGRILADASLAVDHERHLRAVVTGLLVFSALGIVLASALAVILVRRWVIHPVARLREAAMRIAAGDLSYRVEVQGSDELAILSHEMNHMASMLAQMQEERIERERLAAMGEMTRRIVHNLRKPLSGIRALAETTQAELPPESDLIEVQARILKAVDRFEEWLRDVLQASTPLSLTICDVEVEPWIRSVLDAHRPQAEMQGVELCFEMHNMPPKVRIDPIHMGHALSAVLSNGIDFSPPQSKLEITVSSENGRWWIRVADAGPGVPEDQVESIFRLYVTNRPAGTGIGLALAKRVAEQHGGSIRVVPRSERANTPGGAVFEFELPWTSGQ